MSATDNGMEAIRKASEPQFPLPANQLAEYVIKTRVFDSDGNIVDFSGQQSEFKDYFTSITQDAPINVTNSAQAIAPVANQVGLLLIPIAAGNFSWGGSTLTTTNTYTFAQADAPIEVRTSGTIYVIRTAATATLNMTIYRLLRT